MAVTFASYISSHQINCRCKTCSARKKFHRSITSLTRERTEARNVGRWNLARRLTLKIHRLRNARDYLLWRLRGRSWTWEKAERE